MFHFTPTSASWINAVEGFFSAITRKRIRRGVFTSVADLQDAIRRYVRDHNRDPKSFVWTKPADAILAKSPSGIILRPDKAFSSSAGQTPNVGRRGHFGSGIPNPWLGAGSG